MKFTVSGASTAPRIIQALEVQLKEAAAAGRRNQNGIVDYAGIYQRVANSDVDIMLGGRHQDFDAVRSNSTMTDMEKGLEIVRQLTEHLIAAYQDERNGEAIAAKVVEVISAADVMDADVGAVRHASQGYEFDAPVRQSLNISIEKMGIVGVHKSSEWVTCRTKVGEDGHRGVLNGKPVLKTDMRFEISPAGVSTKNGPMLRMDLTAWHHSGDSTVPVARELSTPALRRTFLQLVKDVLADFCGRAGIRFSTRALDCGQAVTLAQSRGEVDGSKGRNGRDGYDHFTSTNAGAFKAKNILPGQQLASLARPQAWKADAVAVEINKIDRAAGKVLAKRRSLDEARCNTERQMREIVGFIQTDEANSPLIKDIGKAKRAVNEAIESFYQSVSVEDYLRDLEQKLDQATDVLQARNDTTGLSEADERRLHMMLDQYVIVGALRAGSFGAFTDLREVLSRINARLERSREAGNAGTGTDADSTLLGLHRDINALVEVQHTDFVHYLSVPAGPDICRFRAAYQEASQSLRAAEDRLKDVTENHPKLRQARETHTHLLASLRACDQELAAFELQAAGLYRSHIRNALVAEGSRTLADQFALSIQACANEALVGQLRGAVPIANYVFSKVNSAETACGGAPADGTTKIASDEASHALEELAEHLTVSGIPREEFLAAYEQVYSLDATVQLTSRLDVALARGNVPLKVSNACHVLESVVKMMYPERSGRAHETQPATDELASQAASRATVQKYRRAMLGILGGNWANAENILKHGGVWELVQRIALLNSDNPFKARMESCISDILKLPLELRGRLVSLANASVEAIFANSLEQLQVAIDASRPKRFDPSRGKDMRHRDLSDVDFSGMDLRGVDFTRATLNGANFQGANIRGVKFVGASLVGANMMGVVFLPPGLKVDLAVTVLDSPLFAGAKLQGLLHTDRTSMGRGKIDEPSTSEDAAALIFTIESRLRGIFTDKHVAMTKSVHPI
ncbi:pentapeptide repeat-containing protein [Cupriavidus pampae]|uniref:Pentapeptide repeat-containing protein n=1 Tax=Cupriavidus pampae TaxID=659251 RepID=A0ABN7ZMA0_9BURK|nr:pentapeptide repeat-containing protein [Cupriavidus pampae]CAG9187074.1 hypothetical protein LMG32289_06760 [Cupriavidus pampae]